MHKIFTVDYNGVKKDGSTSDRTANVVARSAEAAKRGLVRKMKWHFETVQVKNIRTTPIDLILDN
jgi:hypothetical protein